MNPGSARLIQEALRTKGYLATISGELDQETSAALWRFQRDEELAQTVSLGAAYTLSRLPIGQAMHRCLDALS